jgi:hypothetical protein
MFKLKRIPPRNVKVIYGKVDLVKRPRSNIFKTLTYDQLEFSNPLMNDYS